MKRLFLFLPLTCISALLHAQLNLSDTTAIREIIISENRLEIPFSKRNRNVVIIQKEEIAKLPARSINEVLGYLPGVDIRQRGPFGTQADISIDGGSFDQTLVLINGVKVSDIQTGHHSMNIPLSLDAVERIEVLKGPAARVYGINALTGAINIITKTSKEKSLSMRLESGSSFEGKEVGDGKGVYAAGNVQAVANLSTDKTAHLLSLAGQLANGQRYNSNAADIKTFYQGKYAVSAKDYIDVMGGYIYNEFGANGFYAAPGDRDSYEIVKTNMFSIGSSHQLLSNFVLKPRFSYRGNQDDYRYYKHDLSVGRSEHESKVYSAELNSLLNTGLGDFGFGLESRHERIESTNLGDHHRYNHGLYVEYKTEAFNRFLVNLGTYVNYNTQYGWQVFPGIDIGYALHQYWTASVSVGSSQRIPTYTDLYLKQAGNIGNSNLKSENAWQYEATIRYEKLNYYFQAAVFHRNITDFIDWIREDVTLPYQSFNIGSNKILGLNVTFGQTLPLAENQHLKYNLSYNYLKPKEMQYATVIDSKYIIESLKHQAILRLVYQVDKLDATLSGRWIQRELNDPYFISDARLGYNLSKFSLYAGVNNLFDASYKEVAAIHLPKRWFSIGLRYQWQK